LVGKREFDEALSLNGQGREKGKGEGEKVDFSFSPTVIFSSS
jgi:hypothetical protein